MFGSAFDPPHLGHADVVRQLLAGHDRVLMVPAAAHAFGKSMQPFAIRYTLLEALIDEQFADEPRVQHCPIEAELLASRPGHPVYSIELMQALERRFPRARLSLVLGPDNAAPETFQRFHRWRELAAWPLCVVQERLPIRSSEIRAQLAANPPPTAESLRGLTGAAVAERLLALGLYRSPATD